MARARLRRVLLVAAGAAATALVGVAVFLWQLVSAPTRCPPYDARHTWTPDTEVILTAVDVPVGHTVRAEHLVRRTLPSLMIPDEAYREPEDVLGRVAAERILAGEYLREERLVGPDTPAEDLPCRVREEVRSSATDRRTRMVSDGRRAIACTLAVVACGNGVERWDELASDEPDVPVVMATATLDRHREVTVDRLVVRHLPAHLAPEDGFGRLEDVVGRVTGEVVYAGEFVHAGQLAEPEVYRGDVPPRGWRTSALRLPVGTAGILEAGAFVDVITACHHDRRVDVETVAEAVRVLGVDEVALVDGRGVRARGPMRVDVLDVVVATYPPVHWEVLQAEEAGCGFQVTLVDGDEASAAAEDWPF